MTEERRRTRSGTRALPVLQGLMAQAAEDRPSPQELEALWEKVASVYEADRSVAPLRQRRRWRPAPILGAAVLGLAGAAAAGIVLSSPAPPERTERASARVVSPSVASVRAASPTTEKRAPAADASAPTAPPADATAPAPRAQQRSQLGSSQALDPSSYRSSATPAPRAHGGGEPSNTAPTGERAALKHPQGPSEELRLISEAQARLRADPAAALRLTARHRATYPEGRFLQEREVVAIEAHHQLGDDQKATARYRAFVRRFPSSPYRERLEALLVPGVPPL